MYENKSNFSRSDARQSFISCSHKWQKAKEGKKEIEVCLFCHSIKPNTNKEITKNNIKEVEIFLVGNIPSKKNSKQIFFNKKTGKRFITSSDNFKSWHDVALKSIIEQKTPHFLKENLKVDITLNYGSKRKFDLSNKAESILDLLVDAGIIIDDNFTIVKQLNLKIGEYKKDIWNAKIKICG